MTIFNDLENALSPYVGGNDSAGAILGISTIVIFFVGFLIGFGKDFFKGNTGFVIMMVVIGFASAPGIDWFPLWVPFLIVVALALMYWTKGLF